MKKKSRLVDVASLCRQGTPTCDMSRCIDVKGENQFIRSAIDKGLLSRRYKIMQSDLWTRITDEIDKVTNLSSSKIIGTDNLSFLELIPNFCEDSYVKDAETLVTWTEKTTSFCQENFFFSSEIWRWRLKKEQTQKCHRGGKRESCPKENKRLGYLTKPCRSKNAECDFGPWNWPWQLNKPIFQHQFRRNRQVIEC